MLMITTKIEVAWNKPSNGACVSEYEVRVEPAPAFKDAAPPPSPVSTKDYKLTISGLRNDAEYTVTATAKGPGGSASAATKVTTTGQVLYPPTGVTGRPLSTSAIRVAWDKAPADACVAGSACVTGFYVEVIPPKQAKSTATKAFKYPTGRVSVDISGLERNTVYTVRVYSENGKGRSAPTEFKVKTL